MTIVPQCVNARYEAIDDLVSEIREQQPGAPQTSGEEAGFGTKLMCKFWDYLKMEPHADIENVVQERLASESELGRPSCGAPPLCAGSDSKEVDDARCNLKRMIQDLCCEPGASKNVKAAMRCEVSKCVSVRGSASHASAGSCGSRGRGKRGRGGSRPAPRAHSCDPGPKEPLTGALQGIKKAQTFDSNCAWKLHDLLAAEERIGLHVQRLEVRELEGITDLLQAEAAWTNMEEQYTAAVRAAQARQTTLLAQEKEVRQNLAKWRARERQVFSQVEESRTSTRNVEEKAKEKRREAERVRLENEALTERAEATRKELAVLKMAMEKKRETTQNTVRTVEQEIGKLEKQIREEKARRGAKVEAGRGTAAGARDNLATACRVLLQLRLELEDHNTEEETLKVEIDVMKETMDHCDDRCRAKVQLLRDEVADLEGKIANFRQKCTQCNQCCSTSDFKRFCTDCPRCVKEMGCTYEDKTHCCTSESNVGCVCHSVKSKFVENILENMYNILDADMRKNGDELAGEVLDCLGQSTNGKLDKGTRAKVHEYVLKTVQNNLEMSVMGGAMKTRCEMDPETRDALQLCLKDITVTAPSKEEDKESPEKKGPEKKDPNRRDSDKKGKGKKDSILKADSGKGACKRWGGAAACQCPKGPDACECGKAPAPPATPRSCGGHVSTRPSKASISSRRGPTTAARRGGGSSSGGSGVRGGGVRGVGPCSCRPNVTTDTCACASLHSAGSKGSGRRARERVGCDVAGGCREVCPSISSAVDGQRIQFDGGSNTSRNVPLSAKPSKQKSKPKEAKADETPVPPEVEMLPPGGTRPKPTPHRCILDPEKYLKAKKSNLSNKSSVISKRSSASMKSQSSAHADDHGFLCHLLSRISTSLHSYFHPPRRGGQARPGRRGGPSTAGTKNQPYSTKPSLPPPKTAPPTSRNAEPPTSLKTVDGLSTPKKVAPPPPTKKVDPSAPPKRVELPSPSKRADPTSPQKVVPAPTAIAKDDPAVRVVDVAPQEIPLKLPTIKGSNPIVKIPKGQEKLTPAKAQSTGSIHPRGPSGTSAAGTGGNSKKVVSIANSTPATSSNFLSNLMSRIIKSVQSLFWRAPGTDSTAPLATRDLPATTSTVTETKFKQEEKTREQGNVEDPSKQVIELYKPQVETTCYEKSPCDSAVCGGGKEMDNSNVLYKKDIDEKLLTHVDNEVENADTSPVINQQGSVLPEANSEIRNQDLISDKPLIELYSKENRGSLSPKSTLGEEQSCCQQKPSVVSSKQLIDLYIPQKDTRISKRESISPQEKKQAKAKCSPICPNWTPKAEKLQSSELYKPESHISDKDQSKSSVKFSNSEIERLEKLVDKLTFDACADICDATEIITKEAKGGIEQISPDKSIKKNKTKADNVKRNPDGSIVYCDPLRCTGPCSKRKKNAITKIAHSVSPVSAVKQISKTVRNPSNKPCKCHDKKHKKSSYMQPNFSQNSAVRNMLREIYVPIEPTMVQCIAQEKFSNEACFYGHGELFRGEISKLEEETHLVDYNMPEERSIGTDASSNYCRSATRSGEEMKRRRTPKDINAEIERQLPEFLKDFHQPRPFL